MTTPEECKNGLTRECFEKHPAYAKQAFTARLLYLLIGPEGSSLLQKVLTRSLGPPGADISPVSPLPPGAPPIAPTPIDPWQPGPPDQPPATPPATPYFVDYFLDLTTNPWLESKSGTGSATIDTEWLLQTALVHGDYANIYLTNAATPPANYTIEIYNKPTIGPGYGNLVFWNGAVNLSFNWKPNTTLEVSKVGGWQQYTVDSFLNKAIVWKLIVTGNSLDVLRDDVEVISNHILPPFALIPGRITLGLQNDGTIRTDYVIITPN